MLQNLQIKNRIFSGRRGGRRGGGGDQYNIGWKTPMLNHPNEPPVTLESTLTTRNALESTNKKLHFFETRGGAGGKGWTKTKIWWKTPMVNHPNKPPVTLKSNRTTINTLKLANTEDGTGGTDRQTDIQKYFLLLFWDCAWLIDIKKKSLLDWRK